jgi:hypothetical protein
MAYQWRGGIISALVNDRTDDDDDTFSLDPEQDQMLADALVKACRLVANLEQQQRELLKSPPAIEPEKLAQGKTAMENALASARRMLKALEEAVVIRIQADPKNQDVDHHDN